MDHPQRTDHLDGRRAVSIFERSPPGRPDVLDIGFDHCHHLCVIAVVEMPICGLGEAAEEVGVRPENRVVPLSGAAQFLLGVLTEQLVDAVAAGVRVCHDQ